MFEIAICNAAREGARKGIPAVKRESGLSGTFGPNPPRVVTAPEYIQVGVARPPPWCQSCCESLSNKRAIAFEYDFYPNDHRSLLFTWYIHESCEAVSQGIPKH